MFATANSNSDFAVFVSIFVFVVAGILHFTAREPDRRVYSRFANALVAFGLAIFALSFVINP